MNLIYVSFLLSAILMLIISIYLWGFEFKVQTQLSLSKQIILGVFIIISTFLSQWIYRKTIQRVQPTDQIIVKLQTFQSAAIYRLTILEFTFIITILFFIFTKSWSILVISFALLLIIIFCKPTRRSFIKYFNLSEEDKKFIISK
jgi:hypothetical protein